MDTASRIAELTRYTTHTQAYRRGTEVLLHRVTAPPLLWQLANAQYGTSMHDERAGSGFGSRPVARVESMDALRLIHQEATEQIQDLGGIPTTRKDQSTIGLVRYLGSLIPAAGQEQADRAEQRVARWYTLARVATGWDSACWRPRNTCPVCQTLSSLRIRVADLEGFCAECHTSWDQTQIGVLAEHIRYENGDQGDTPQTEEIPLEPVAC